MARITISILAVIALQATTAYATQCSLSTSNNLLDQITETCPKLWESSSKSYCCVDLNNKSFYCCDAEEFALKTGLGIIVPAIIAVVVIISLVLLCISCLCCTCCPWYRRRHRGTVYGNLQAPGGVHVIQTSSAQHGYVVAGHHAQNQLPVYATVASAMPQQQQYQPPPQYTQEAYTQQSPYNPNYNQ